LNVYSLAWRRLSTASKSFSVGGVGADRVWQFALSLLEQRVLLAMIWGVAGLEC